MSSYPVTIGFIQLAISRSASSRLSIESTKYALRRLR